MIIYAVVIVRSERVVGTFKSCGASAREKSSVVGLRMATKNSRGRDWGVVVMCNKKLQCKITLASSPLVKRFPTVFLSRYFNE